MEHDLIEMIIVFKKDIDPETANAILDQLAVKHREGMDSSKGKAYFYQTGPKAIVTFNNPEEKKKFIEACQPMTEIHEIYVARWDDLKD